MYIKVPVENLSERQQSRLRNGHGVIVRHHPQGRHHIHMSHEQHKKMSRAYHKGMGMTITLDPYQMNHHKIHGHGLGHTIMRGLRAAARNPVVRKLGKEIAHQGVNALQAAATAYAPEFAPAIQMGADYANNRIGNGVRRRMPAKRGRGFGSTIMKGLKSVARNPAVRKLGKELAHQGINTLAGVAREHLPTGLRGIADEAILEAHSRVGNGIRRRRRRRGGALVAAGY